MDSVEELEYSDGRRLRDVSDINECSSSVSCSSAFNASTTSECSSAGADFIRPSLEARRPDPLGSMASSRELLRRAYRDASPLACGADFTSKSLPLVGLAAGVAHSEGPGSGAVGCDGSCCETGVGERRPRENRPESARKPVPDPGLRVRCGAGVAMVIIEENDATQTNEARFRLASHTCPETERT